MNITEIKDLMSQFDQSSLREFSYSNAGETLHFSKNQQAIAAPSPKVEAPLASVVAASSAPDKPAFVAVGDTVKKGQTLMIIEAMKVMNEVPADRDGVVTEILVANQDVVEFGQGLVRIK
ncbi:acetyl-CoA carboxylase biotin carboxyl carrier protein [Streptococcus suis]